MQKHAIITAVPSFTHVVTLTLKSHSWEIIDDILCASRELATDENDIGKRNEQMASILQVSTKTHYNVGQKTRFEA